MCVCGCVFYHPIMSDEDPNEFSICNYCFLCDLTGFITVHAGCVFAACCWHVCDLTHFPSHSNIWGLKRHAFQFPESLSASFKPSAKETFHTTHPHMWQPNFKVKFTSLQEANKQEPREAQKMYEYKADFLFIYRFFLFQILHIRFPPSAVIKFE